MRWDDERYVRLYTRDTVEEIALTWQARAVWREMLRKFDRAGIIPLGRAGMRGLADLLRMPLDVVEATMPELLEDGRIVLRDGVVFAPNFTDAQETRTNDAERKRQQRERARDHAKRPATPPETPALPFANGESSTITSRVGHTESHAVTDGHTESRNVTPCCAVPGHAVPTSAVDPPAADASGGDGRRRSREPTGPKPPSAKDEYAEAYQAGIVAACGRELALLDDKRPLVQLAKYPKDADGKPLTGPALRVWIRETAESFRRAQDGRGQYWSGFSPAGCLKWLNSECPEGDGKRNGRPRVQGGQ
jgi:hypothetical protein